MDKRYTFPKEERIYSQREIDTLFDRGTSFISYPLRIIYVEQKTFSGSDIAVLISVPKKKFKKATERNRLKRLIRESYRLNKIPLSEFVREKDSGLLIGFLFVGNKLISFKEMEVSMKKALAILKEKTE